MSVKNAENQGDGRSTATAALFGYSTQLGSDQIFSAAEVSSNRTPQFNDSGAELFSFDVNVTAFQSTAGGGSAGSGGASSGGSSSTSGGSGSGGGSLLPLSRVMRISVNPLTRIVTARLL